MRKCPDVCIMSRSVLVIPAKAGIQGFEVLLGLPSPEWRFIEGYRGFRISERLKGHSPKFQSLPNISLLSTLFPHKIP